MTTLRECAPIVRGLAEQYDLMEPRIVPAFTCDALMSSLPPDLFPQVLELYRTGCKARVSGSGFSDIPDSKWFKQYEWEERQVVRAARLFQLADLLESQE